MNNDGNIYDHYIAFHEQPIEKKAQILYELCEHRLYAKERPSKVDELEEDELRVEPIGQDSQGCLYFYFFGTRLYRGEFGSFWFSRFILLGSARNRFPLSILLINSQQIH